MFTCVTVTRTEKVEIQFLSILSTFNRVNLQEICTIRKSFKIRTKGDL